MRETEIIVVAKGSEKSAFAMSPHGQAWSDSSESFMTSLRLEDEGGGQSRERFALSEVRNKTRRVSRICARVVLPPLASRSGRVLPVMLTISAAVGEVALDVVGP